MTRRVIKVCILVEPDLTIKIHPRCQYCLYPLNALRSDFGKPRARNQTDDPDAAADMRLLQRGPRSQHTRSRIASPTRSQVIALVHHCLLHLGDLGTVTFYIPFTRP